MSSRPRWSHAVPVPASLSLHGPGEHRPRAESVHKARYLCQTRVYFKYTLSILARAWFSQIRFLESKAFSTWQNIFLNIAKTAASDGVPRNLNGYEDNCEQMIDVFWQLQHYGFSLYFHFCDLKNNYAPKLRLRRILYGKMISCWWDAGAFQ